MSRLAEIMGRVLCDATRGNMKIEELPPGESLAGYIVDGIEDTPYIGATLVVDEYWGPLLSFSHPMMHGLDERGSAQFSAMAKWAEDASSIPPVLVFVCAEGRAAFFNCGFLRSKENWAFGVNFTLRPETILYGTFEVPFGEQLALTSLKSCMSGLGEFMGTSVFNTSRETDDEGRSQSYTATVKSPEAIEFSVAEYDLKFSLSWRSTMPNGLELHMQASAWFETHCSSGRTIAEHLALHRQMRAILALNFGNGAWISEHLSTLSGDPTRAIRTTHVSTFKEALNEAARDRRKTSPGLTSLQRVDLGRISDWLENRDYWSRATGPVLSLLQRETYAIEDRVIAAGIAVETIGKRIPRADGEEVTYKLIGQRKVKTFATWMFRCISGCGLDFAGSGHSNYALAQAFAQTYNKTKHYEQARQPEQVTTRYLGQFGLLVIRAVALKHLMTSTSEISGITDYTETHRINDILKDFEIAEDGWATYRRLEQEG